MAVISGLVCDRFLAEHEAAGGGEGGDEVKRCLVGAAIVASTRSLAVDGDAIQSVGPGLPRPGREGDREQLRVDTVHQDGQPSGARNAMMIGQEAAQERQMRFAPFRDPFVIVAIRDRAAHDRCC
jgi:hypothetical protein